jgi:hypothetical protein
MRTRVFLSPADIILSGKFPSTAEHVHVILDSTDSAFTVTLPDLIFQQDREFIFYNLPSSGAGNNVTIIPVGGQEIRIGEQSHVLAALDTVGFVSDMKSRWLLSDTNH